jgi:hypothetical protein
VEPFVSEYGRLAIFNESLDEEGQRLGDPTSLVGHYPPAFFYFLPEIADPCPKVLADFVRTHMTYPRHHYHPPRFADREFIVSIELPVLQEGNWRILKELRDGAWHLHQVARAIQKDDADEFKQAFGLKLAEIPPFPLVNSEVMSLLGFAARCGSIKCAEFLPRMGAHWFHCETCWVAVSLEMIQLFETYEAFKHCIVTPPKQTLARN